MLTGKYRGHEVRQRYENCVEVTVVFELLTENLIKSVHRKLESLPCCMKRTSQVTRKRDQTSRISGLMRHPKPPAIARAPTRAKWRTKHHRWILPKSLRESEAQLKRSKEILLWSRRLFRPTPLPWWHRRSTWSKRLPGTKPSAIEAIPSHWSMLRCQVQWLVHYGDEQEDRLENNKINSLKLSLEKLFRRKRSCDDLVDRHVDIQNLVEAIVDVDTRKGSVLDSLAYLLNGSTIVTVENLIQMGVSVVLLTFEIRNRTEAILSGLVTYFHHSVTLYSLSLFQSLPHVPQIRLGKNDVQR